jgi:hypothetical protein
VDGHPHFHIPLFQTMLLYYHSFVRKSGTLIKMLGFCITSFCLSQVLGKIQKLKQKPTPFSETNFIYSEKSNLITVCIGHELEQSIISCFSSYSNYSKCHAEAFLSSEDTSKEAIHC